MCVICLHCRVERELSSEPVVLTLEAAPESVEGLVRPDWGPVLRVSVPAGLERGLGTHIPNEFPGDADAPRHPLRTLRGGRECC